jgi:8-oxo-dGTP diphosphatase
MAEQDVVQVAAAVIVDAAGRVLVAERPLDRHQGGLWEFPGGKVEAEEPPRAALARELWEELGITIKKSRPLIRVRHDYPDKAVRLDVWRVDEFEGRPHGREGQAIAWVAPEELCRRNFPAADRPIIAAARLPPLYLVTPEPGEDTVAFLDRLRNRLAAGISLVQLRAKALAPAAYAALARKVVDLCRASDTKLLLNAPPALAAEVGAAGVHLTAARLMALEERPLPAEMWVGASCHDEQELAHACRIGVDFVVVAPVLATASHPAARPLGWAALQRLTDLATVPVYALGGMKRSDLPKAWEYGAQGIAAVSGLWEERVEGSGRFKD